VLATPSVTGGKTVTDVSGSTWRCGSLGVVDPLALFFLARCGTELRVFSLLLP